MSLTLIIVLVLGVVIIIAGAAFVLYKAGFSVDKIRAKFGPVEVEASRTKPPTTPATKEVGPSIHQQAEEGGVITESGITAPANSIAEIEQRAKGQKSKIDDSPIKLT
jgi:hypothetical protein